jgi:hypothetical protein
MTLFEYLAAAYTLLLSFGVARLVFGLPSATLQDRRYWVHLVFVVGFAFMLVVLFWSFWSFRDVAWTFPRFLLVLTHPVLALLMASTLIPESPDNVESWRDFYYSIRSKYFSAWIVLSFLLAISGTFLIDMPFTHPARLAELSLVAFGVVGVLSSNPRVHGAMAICAIGVVVFVSSVVMFEPGSLTR